MKFNNKLVKVFKEEEVKIIYKYFFISYKESLAFSWDEKTPNIIKINNGESIPFSYPAIGDFYVFILTCKKYADEYAPGHSQHCHVEHGELFDDIENIAHPYSLAGFDGEFAEFFSTFRKMGSSEPWY